MSVQTNQYFMYGIRLSWDEYKAVIKIVGEDVIDSYQDDSAFTDEVKHKDGLFVLSDDMNGEYAIIGRVIAKSSDGEYLGEDPIPVGDYLSLYDKIQISDSIINCFGFGIGYNHCGYWFITKYR